MATNLNRGTLGHAFIQVHLWKDIYGTTIGVCRGGDPVIVLDSRDKYSFVLSGFGAGWVDSWYVVERGT